MAEHYFTAEPASPDERRTLRVELAGNEVTLQTAPGVFSATRLDPGTRVLLRGVPEPPSTGNLLDLGCGWGPLALRMALNSPQATVWAVDVNRRALDLVRHNAQSLGLTNIRAVEPDAVPTNLQFDTIWSNPPIRIGKTELHDLLTRWLNHLTPEGQAWLVVQRSLGSDSLAGWLRASGWNVEKASSAKGYRVLRTGR